MHCFWLWDVYIFSLAVVCWMDGLNQRLLKSKASFWKFGRWFLWWFQDLWSTALWFLVVTGVFQCNVTGNLLCVEKMQQINWSCSEIGKLLHAGCIKQLYLWTLQVTSGLASSCSKNIMPQHLWHAVLFGNCLWPCLRDLFFGLVLANLKQEAVVKDLVW